MTFNVVVTPEAEFQIRVYYQLTDKTVVVLAVWHANRGAGPDLAALIQSE